MTETRHIKPDHIRSLLEAKSTPCISICVPMERRGPDTRKNPILFKNALKEVRDALKARGMDPDEIRSLLDPVEALVEDTDFWQRQQDALALYLAPDTFQSFILKDPVERRVEVGERFSVLPLLAALDHPDRAYVLVLSENAVRLYRWGAGSVELQEVPNLPANQAEALQLDPEKSLQQHTVSGRGADGVIGGVHGHGRGKDTKAEYREEFLHRVNDAVRRFLEAERAPLVLATVREEFSLYQKINTYAHLSEVSLEGNYEHASETELGELLAKQLSAQYRARVEADLRALGEAEGEGLATADVAELVRVSHEGRLRRLYLAWPPVAVTGRWEADRFEATVDVTPDPRHEDLLELAAAETWRQGGEVRMVPADRWPRKEPCLGELRWVDAGS